MHVALQALENNNIWHWVSWTPGMNVIGSRWVYKIKLNLMVELKRFKTRLVDQGYSQVSKVDFDETFTLVIKPTTIRVILSIDIRNK